MKTGDTVTFRFTNSGKARHDAFTRDTDAQTGHEEEMLDDAGAHHEAGMKIDVEVE